MLVIYGRHLETNCKFTGLLTFYAITWRFLCEDRDITLLLKTSSLDVKIPYLQRVEKRMMSNNSHISQIWKSIISDLMTFFLAACHSLTLYQDSLLSPGTSSLDIKIQSL